MEVDRLMTRAERKRLEREQAKENVTYTLTAKQIADIRENAYNEAKAELTKVYDKQWFRYYDRFEERVLDAQTVSTNRSLVYILGCGVDVLTRKFGFNKKQNHKWFDEVRLLFNEGPAFDDMITKIADLSGWDVQPTLEEVTYEEDR